MNWIGVFLIIATTTVVMASKDRSAPPIQKKNTAYVSKVHPQPKTESGSDLFPKKYLPIKIYHSVLASHHAIQHKLKLDEHGDPKLDYNNEFDIPVHKWKFVDCDQPLKVQFSAERSGMNPILVKQILKETYDVWRDVSGVRLPPLELIEVPEMVPSSYSKNQVNGINEIAFRNLSSLKQSESWSSEKWKWPDRTDDSILVEVDTVFEERYAWEGNGKEHGNANQWKSKSNHALDFRNQAVTHWGELLGFKYSSNHAHTMCGMSAKGQVHKYSLERSDEAVARYSYPSI